MVCPPFFLFFIFGVTLVHANLYMYILASVSDFTLAAKVNLGKVKSSKFLITLFANHIQKNHSRAEY